MIKEDLQKACNLIDKEPIPRFLEEYFLRLYPFSNENLSGYLRNNNYHNKSVLTVGSSADQILNLINYNCQDITLVDINPFVKYYYELKKAAILGLNNQEYLNFFNTNNSFKIFDSFLNSHIYKHISKYLEPDTKTFWDAIFTLYKPQLIKKLFMATDLTKKKLIANNDYLQPDNFKELRKKIEHSNIIFKTDNIINMTNTNSQYDYLFLSNVFDYLFNIRVKLDDEVYEILKTDYLSLVYNLTRLLNNHGLMYFQYLWDIDNAENNFYYLYELTLKNCPNIKRICFPGSNQLPREIDCVYVYKKTLSHK